MNTGIQGMQSSYNAIEKAADKIAKAGVDNSNAPISDTVVAADNQIEVASPFSVNNQQQTPVINDVQENIIDPIIEMKIQQHVFDASAKVVKSADEMLGTIMDIKA